MTLRYAALAAPAVRTAYEEAMSNARTRLTPAIAPAGQPIIPGRIEWQRGEMLKTRVAHGYCSRQLAAEACPYANICEQCNNYLTAPEFIPQLQAQLTDITALRDDETRRASRDPLGSNAAVAALTSTDVGSHYRRYRRDSLTCAVTVNGTRHQEAGETTPWVPAGTTTKHRYDRGDDEYCDRFPCRVYPEG